MKKLIPFVFTIFMFLSFSAAEPIDLKNTSILISPKIKTPVKETLLKVLQEEVEKRTSLTWQSTDKWNAKDQSYIAIALSNEKNCRVEQFRIEQN